MLLQNIYLYSIIKIKDRTLIKYLYNVPVRLSGSYVTIVPSLARNEWGLGCTAPTEVIVSCNLSSISYYLKKTH